MTGAADRTVLLFVGYYLLYQEMEKKMVTVLPSVAERLKPLRIEKKKTQKEMAVLLGCTEQHYQKIEYGKVNLPSTTLMFLADFFGVTTDYLLGRSDERD